MPQPQSFKSHARTDPFFMFLIMPLLLLNVAFAIYATIRSWDNNRPYHHTHLWWIVMSIVFILMAGLTRHYAIKNQDRIIRLEEQLRLADLLPELQLHLIDAITIKQYVALRFASDAEVPALAARAVAENLDPKQIKESITTWRPDHHRV